jgi:hypothetical protein
MIKRELFLQEITRLKHALERLGVEISIYRIDPPADEVSIKRIENQIKRRIPTPLKDFFKNISRNTDIFWNLEEDNLFGNGLCGGITLSLEALPGRLLNWSGWEDDPGFHENHLIIYTYDQLFPLIPVQNGDEIAYVESGIDKGAVVYLNHENDDFNNVILSPTFDDFIRVWTTLGWPGPQHWDIEQFYDYEKQMLSTTTDRSRKWLMNIGTTCL